MAAGGASVETYTTFDEAWPILQEEAINKLIESLETDQGQPTKGCFTSQEYMRFYIIVYNVCIQIHSPEVQKMYDQYKKTFVDYISSKVLPSLKGKEDINLLTELLRSWKKYKIMCHWLSRFFYSLSRYYIPLRKLPSLVETSNSAFHNLVFGEIKDEVKDAIISMINREREGEHFDNAFLMDIIDMYEGIGEDSSKKYGEEAENSRKALKWIANLYEIKVAQHDELLNVQASKLEELKLRGPVA